MSKHNLISDAKLVLNGLQKVLTSQAVAEKVIWENKFRNSSVDVTSQQLAQFVNNQTWIRDPKNTLERASMVPLGIQAYCQHAILPKLIQDSKVLQKESKLPEDEILLIREEDLEGIYIQSLGVELVQENKIADQWRNAVLDQANPKQHSGAPNLEPKRTVKVPFQDDSPKEFQTKSINNQILDAAVKVDDMIESNVDPNHTLVSSQTKGTFEASSSSTLADLSKPIPDESNLPRHTVKPLSKRKPESRLGATSKERKVPASRISRLVSYGGLAAGLGLGAMTEATRRSLGMSDNTKDSSSLFLNDANAERIVDTLCRVRGAALKLGQILSIQDDTMINPKLQQIFERVRHSADFMPSWQMEKMMEAELGHGWKTKFLEFDMTPFAAASIGQVHLGKLLDGRPVAVKVQYPGVAKGIESDIDNLMSVLNVWNILPEGIFADNIISVAKRELRWEVDYIREMECAKRFKTLLEPYPDYYVPEVVDEFTTKLVYTTELIEGIPVDKCETLDQDARDRICYLMLDLFFRELFEFRFMQTDPNWSNFLYNVDTKQIGLLDFGASREYSKEFTDKYLRILKGAATEDTRLVLEVSREIGFLTGYESKAMENAHLESVMILGEPFRVNSGALYNFGTQKITQRLQELVPVMVKERLCPPPEEIYSLHRKLSGVFLLCARLKGRVRCRPMFERVWEAYEQEQSKLQDS